MGLLKGKYVIGIDQSTQGTKALLFDDEGALIKRVDKPHQQKINDKGWVSHDPIEIYNNTIDVVDKLIKESSIDKNNIIGVGISNQRETSLAWDRDTGEPICDAIVWQCSRAASICDDVEKKGFGEMIFKKTGIKLSPYFPASKISWILKNNDVKNKNICHGTVDTFLIYKLTKGKEYKTDYSNASRTQLFNIFDLKWDKEICDVFGIDVNNLPEVCDSNSLFGYTDFDGILNEPIPIHGVLGDSHGALFGQGCLKRGMIKATYGTGSSIMMNIGETPVLSTHGVVTSLAWRMDGKTNYVLEGNLNYTGAVISWIKNDLKMINSASETSDIAKLANQSDKTYIVPAFSGLGAPYWDSYASAIICGVTRTTGKNEIVKAGVDCIAHQITDVIEAMTADSDIKVESLRVDGGPTRNDYLMQLQSEFINADVLIPESEELSGIGAAYACGIALKLWDKSIFDKMKRTRFSPKMERKKVETIRSGWRKAVEKTLYNNDNK